MSAEKKDDRTRGETDGNRQTLYPDDHKYTEKDRNEEDKVLCFQPAPGDTGKPCGVDYELKTIVAGSDGDISKPKKQSVFSPITPISKEKCTCQFNHLF